MRSKNTWGLCHTRGVVFPPSPIALEGLAREAILVPEQQYSFMPCRPITVDSLCRNSPPHAWRARRGRTAGTEDAGRGLEHCTPRTPIRHAWRWFSPWRAGGRELLLDG